MVIITGMDTLEMNPKSNYVNDSQNESAKSAKEIVMEFLQALIERRDFKSARSLPERQHNVRVASQFI